MTPFGCFREIRELLPNYGSFFGWHINLKVGLGLVYGVGLGVGTRYIAVSRNWRPYFGVLRPYLVPLIFGNSHLPTV